MCDDDAGEEFEGGSETALIYQPPGQDRFIASFYSNLSTEEQKKADKDSERIEDSDLVTFSYGSTDQYERAVQIIGEAVGKINRGTPAREVFDTDLDGIISETLGGMD